MHAHPNLHGLPAANVVPLASPAFPSIPSDGGFAGCVPCQLRQECIAACMARSARQSAGQLLIGRRRVRKGECLYREGQPFRFVYAVRYGTLKTAFSLDDGDEQVSGFFFAGELIGLEGLARGRHVSHAVALEDSEVCCIPYEEMARLPAAGSAPAPAVRLAQLVSSELVRDQAAKAIAALRQADPRVAAFLLMLSGRMRERGLSGSEFELRMSRAEIGSYLGLTLESVSRAFASFAVQGWIEVHKRSVRVLSWGPLERLCLPALSAVQDRQVPGVDRERESACVTGARTRTRSAPLRCATPVSA